MREDCTGEISHDAGGCGSCQLRAVLRGAAHKPESGQRLDDDQ